VSVNSGEDHKAITEMQNSAGEILVSSITAAIDCV